MGHFGELEMANALKHGVTLGLKMSLAINLPPSDPNSPTKLMVASLIDSDERCWKLDLVREIFTDTDVSHITSIHLSSETSLINLYGNSLLMGVLQSSQLTLWLNKS